MTRKIWIRCVLISLLGTVLAPIVTMTTYIPDKGAQVADLRAIDPKRTAAGVSEQQAAEYMSSIPMRQLQGWERLTYWFEHPNGLLFLRWIYWPAAIGWFALFLVATASVSYLSIRDRRGA